MPKGHTETGSNEDLNRREYRDESGQLHHHTRSYMERHGEAEAKHSRSKSPSNNGAAQARGRGGGASTSKGAKSPGAGKTNQSARTTTDHGEIRRWAEEHGGKPAAVARTHSEDDVGIIRIMFPDAPNSEHGALTEISWDEFFEEFEARQLALLYEAENMFSKIIGRDTAAKRARGDHKAAR